MKSGVFRSSAVIYTFLIYLFLYVPIMVLIVYSFNDSKLNAVWSGFTFKWYAELVHDQAILDATRNSLYIAFLSTVISTMIGTLAAVGMYKYNFRGKSVLDGLLYVPIVIPEIVMGVALLAFFVLLSIPLGLLTLVIAHVTFSIPFVVVVVRARLEGFDRSLEEAAMDLGANQWQTFTRVTFPIILPGILAGSLLALTLSLDDVIISFFVAGPTSTTLPLKVFSMVKFGVSPKINALSTVLLLVVITIAVSMERIRMKKAS